MLFKEGALLGGGTIVSGLSVAYLPLGDGSLWVFVALQWLVFDDVPGDVAVCVVEVDGVRIQAALAHRIMQLKLFN